MLRAIIMSSEDELAGSLTARLGEIDGLYVACHLRGYAVGVELMRIVRAVAPHVMFVGMHSRELALETTSQIYASFPNVQVVAIDRQRDRAVPLNLARAGARNSVSRSLVLEEMRTALSRVESVFDNSRSYARQVYARLPGKAGHDGPALGVNASIALAVFFGIDALPAAFELNQSFLLKRTERYLVMDAYRKASVVDEKF